MLLTEYEPFTLQILEDDTSKGRLVIGGRFQLAETPNANGRTYTRPLWEKILSSDKVKDALGARRMLGLLEHPENGKTDPTKASHIVTSLSLNENNEIIGRAEILNTPNGLILQELFRAGCQMGISSRGTGTLRKGPNGMDFVNEDFLLQTFDVVLTPSTPLAFPKPLSESAESENKELEEMTAHDKYLALEQRASTILEADVSNLAGRRLVESAATKLIVELSSASNEDPSLKDLIAPLIEELNAKRKALKTVAEETTGDADHGFVRTVPVIPVPPLGAGTPLLAGEGPLEGYNANKNPWMKGAVELGGAPIHVEGEEKKEEKPVVTEDKVEEKENPFEKKKKKKCPKCGKESCSCDKKEESVDEAEKDKVMSSFADQVLELPESEENNPFRALAASYLLEHENRVNESEAYSRVINKIQEKLADAEKTGKLVVESTDELLEQKYNVSLHIIEELKNRLKLLSAKVYAEQQLDSIGKKNDKEARQIMAEAIKKDASKASIDEAFVALKSIKPLGVVNNVNPGKKEITESVKKVEGAVNKLNESATGGRGMAVGDMVSRLSRNMTQSRSL
jgi:hypothetical protein